MEHAVHELVDGQDAVAVRVQDVEEPVDLVLVDVQGLQPEKAAVRTGKLAQKQRTTQYVRPFLMRYRLYTT